jgi:CelD/BcsL family acetyltransferase involved in cellulose biosynthesis
MTRPSLAITELGEPPGDEWRRLLASDPAATFFHEWDWSRIYARHHRGTPFFLACTADGKLVGGLPGVRFDRGPIHYLESLPMGTYGGPLVDPEFADAERAWTALLDAFFDRGRRPGCMRCQVVLRDGEDARASGRGFHDTRIHIVPLTGGYESFWFDSFSHSRRKECNRAARRGVIARVNAGPAAVDAYYPLHREAHDRWGLRPHPKAFFLDVLAANRELVWFVSVHHEGRVLGAHLSFVSRDELVLWHGVTTRENTKGLYPSTMLIRAQAEESARRGLRALNLGGSGDKRGIHQQKVLLGGGEAKTATYEWESRWMSLARRFRR